jgi:hypothetical protein
MEDKEQALEVRIEQALTELRVVLPGAQALFGFQFAAVLTERFAQLSVILKGMHLASLSVVAVAVVMLIAPAAYHRIAAAGNAEEGVLQQRFLTRFRAFSWAVIGFPQADPRIWALARHRRLHPIALGCAALRCANDVTSPRLTRTRACGGCLRHHADNLRQSASGHLGCYRGAGGICGPSLCGTPGGARPKA